MKVEAEFEEKEIGDETIEYVSSISFDDCTRKDLQELGKFFLSAAKSLPAPRLGKNSFQVSSKCLRDSSDHFKNLDTMIFVSLDINEV